MIQRVIIIKKQVKQTGHKIVLREILKTDLRPFVYDFFQPVHHQSGLFDFFFLFLADDGVFDSVENGLFSSHVAFLALAFFWFCCIS